jgi:hypothetical protein
VSVAYFIVLDNEDPEFDTCVNGKSLAKEASRLDPICKKLAIPTFDDFLSASAEDLSDMLGEDIQLPEDEEEKWFSPEEGISFVNALTEHIKANPKDVKDAEGVLSDLAEYAEVLEKTKSAGAKWRLSLDF